MFLILDKSWLISLSENPYYLGEDANLNGNNVLNSMDAPLALGFRSPCPLADGFYPRRLYGRSPHSAFLTSAPTTLFSWRFPHEAFLPDGLLAASYVVAVRTRVPEAISA